MGGSKMNGLGMSQNELNEISDAFHEAWTDYFGDEIKVIPYSSKDTHYDEVYGVSKKKAYDRSKAITLTATIRQTEHEDVSSALGKRIEEHYTITFVTKELIDKGLTEIDSDSIIEYTDRFGVTKQFKIYGTQKKVQFLDNKIFTKLKVVYYG